MPAVLRAFPKAKSMEMETFHLLHLSRCSGPKMVAGAAAIVVANRNSADVVDAETLVFMEQEGGRAVLEAIVAVQL
jgi:uridine phosphorylase